MLQSISIVQARNNFSDLLGEVYYGGKRFIITKIGKPLAVLISIDEYKSFEKATKYFSKKIKKKMAKNPKVSS